MTVVSMRSTWSFMMLALDPLISRMAFFITASGVFRLCAKSSMARRYRSRLAFS